MKQVIVLELSDIEKLKSGETIQLTPQLLLSYEATKRSRSNRRYSAQAGEPQGSHIQAPPTTREEKKAAYNRQYRIDRKKREASKKGAV